MNHMLSNFEHNERERQRIKRQYIIDLKNQLSDHATRRKVQELKRKEDDSMFEQKVLKQRQQMKRKYITRRSTLSKTPFLQPISPNSKQNNPEKDSQVKPQLYRSYLYAPIRQLSSFPIKDFSKSELYQSRPKLSFSPNVNYIKAKRSLQQQKQKVVRFRTELHYKSKRSLMRAANTALDNLKQLTIQMKTEPDEASWIRSIKRTKNVKEEDDQAWMTIIKMNQVQY